MTVPDDALEIKRVGAMVTSNEWFTQLVDRCRDWLTLLRRVAWLSRFKIFYVSRPRHNWASVLTSELLLLPKSQRQPTML